MESKSDISLTLDLKTFTPLLQMSGEIIYATKRSDMYIWFL